MSEGDIFREVEEEIRREQFARLWQKYGVFVLLAAAMIVLGVAGYQGWTWWATKRAAEDGATLVRAQALVEEKKLDEAVSKFEKLAEDGWGGYPVLARLRLAAVAAARGESAKAVAAYDAVASDSSAEEMLKGFARIQAATLRLDEAPPDELKRRLEGMTDADGPWRYSARELLAMSAFKHGELGEARRLYEGLLGDPGAPAPMRQRAQMMLSLIAKPADAAKAGKAEAAPSTGKKADSPAAQTN